MELHLLSAEFASLLALILCFCCLLRWKNNTSTQLEPPQPPGSWPVIGHLCLFGELPHKSLGKLADRYGPIFMIKFGIHKALVVSSAKMAKECLGSNDRVFVDRPQTAFVEHLTYNSAMLGFSPYGSYWREIRKITIVELLSNHRVEILKHFRISEVRSAIKALHESCRDQKDSPVMDMKQWFNDISLNSAVRIIAGKSLKEFFQGEKYDQICKALREFFDLGGAFVPVDALPLLRWLDIGGYEKAMKKVAKEIDHVAQDWLDEHKRERVFGKAQGKKDFMDVLLGNFETGVDKRSKFDADTIVKATSMAMILAATDTRAVTLTWALSLLLNNKEALRKAQAELETIVGKERQLNESDLKNLVYLQAILKETMRLYPALPLSLPREAVSNCTVNNYNVPARTQLFVNLHKIHRDPEIWADPEEFLPERFLTTHKDYDVRGQNFEYMPFGSGRRVCPGINLALQFMQFTLASLLHTFDFASPSDKTVDMTEGFGLTNLKATPLEVILIPRLPDYLYNPSNVVT